MPLWPQIQVDLTLNLKRSLFLFWWWLQWWCWVVIVLVVLVLVVLLFFFFFNLYTQGLSDRSEEVAIDELGDDEVVVEYLRSHSDDNLFDLQDPSEGGLF